MKLRLLPQFIGASVLAFSLAVAPSLSASAQTAAPGTTDPTAPGTTTAPDATTITPDTTVDTADAGEDRDFDWGWLGLIGLAGLAGLMRKNDDRQTVTYRDPAEPTTRSRY